MDGCRDVAAQVARRRDSTPAGPDWETLPEALLCAILQKVSLDGCEPSHFLVSKRWWAVAKQALLSFDLGGNPDGNRCRHLVREIAQFPSLTSVHLSNRSLTDPFLEALGGEAMAYAGCADQGLQHLEVRKSGRAQW